MKSEDEMLCELRDGLAKFAASSMTMQRVEAKDYPLVDHRFYTEMAARISNLGFNAVGDFVSQTGQANDGNLRCFLRAFIAHDGPYAAACYHPRPKFWAGVLARVLCGRLGKVVEFETEFSDDTWVITTTAPKARLLDPPPLIIREHHPERIPVDELFGIHKGRVRSYLRANAGVAARKVFTVAGLERSQSRQHDIVAVYRSMVRGLTADEIRRFSVFGRARSAALKDRLDSIGT